MGVALKQNGPHIILEFEILKSEGMRLLVLALLIFLSALVELPTVLFPSDGVSDTAGGIPYSLHLKLVLSMLGLSLLFGLVWLYVGRLIKRQKSGPVFLRFLTSTLELAIPLLLAETFFYSGGSDHYSQMLLAKVFPLYSFFIVLSILRLSIPLSLFTGVLGALSYLGASIPFVESGKGEHAVLAVYILIQALFAAIVARQLKMWLRRTISMTEEKNRIQNIFGQHVSPEVVNRLLVEKHERISETSHVCVMFLDIRNFTAFSEKKTPDEVVGYLDTLFGFMVDIVASHHGIINKFLGDGFMAIFGAPLSFGNDTHNAVRAAQGILKMLNERIRCGEIVDTAIGIGLHSGPVLTGHVGSRERKEYTVIGDTVNTASRIEAQTKEYSLPLLLSESVVAELNGLPVETTYIGETLVKGKREAVKLYTIAEE